MVPYHVLEVKGLHLKDGFDPCDGDNLHLGNDLRQQHTREDAPDCPAEEMLKEKLGKICCYLATVRMMTSTISDVGGATSTAGRKL